MTNLFQANYVLWGDKPGLGAYETGHYLQHQQYVTVLAGQNVFIPDYDIIHMGSGPFSAPGEFLGDDPNEFEAWLNQHYTLHLLLRQQSNTSGPDLTQLDPQSQEMWEIWQEWHAQDHRLFDAHFGTT